MGRPPANLDDNVLQRVIRDLTEHMDNDTHLPTTKEVRDEYNKRTGENLHHKTVRDYLDRTGQYSRTTIRDYTGWRTDDK